MVRLARLARRAAVNAALTAQSVVSAAFTASVCALLVVLTGCGSAQDTPSTPPPSSPTSAPPTGPSAPSGAPSGPTSSLPSGPTPGPPSGQPPSTPGEGAPQTTTPRCTATTLAGSIKPEDAAAGNRYATLIVTNKSKLVCGLYGYGGLQLIDAKGNPNPTNLQRAPNPRPPVVTLQPGEAAHKKLHWTVVPTGDEPVTGPCQPPSTGARVIPPDETEPFTVSYDFGSVCDTGRIEGTTYFKP